MSYESYMSYVIEMSISFYESLKIIWNCSKNYLKNNILVYLCFKKFSIIFCEYIRMENSNYKNKNIEIKYLKYIWKNLLLKVKNSL